MENKNQYLTAFLQCLFTLFSVKSKDCRSPLKWPCERLRHLIQLYVLFWEDRYSSSISTEVLPQQELNRIYRIWLKNRTILPLKFYGYFSCSKLSFGSHNLFQLLFFFFYFLLFFLPVTALFIARLWHLSCNKKDLIIMN